MNDGSSSAARANVISGTFSGPDGPIQNAEVKLTSYKDENCVKLSQSKTKLSGDDEKNYKSCSQQVGKTTSDAQGKYSFPNISEGWYSLTFTWATNVDPVPSNPIWPPLFLWREGEYLITFMATKQEPKFHGLAVGEAFMFSGGESGRKDLTIKKL
jgi:hypothetical protein